MLRIQPDECPYLPRGVRLHDDLVRGNKVLLAPEKAIELDGIGVAILSRVTGKATFAAIVDDLVETFDAPRDQIEQDVQSFLSRLRGRMYLRVTS